MIKKLCVLIAVSIIILNTSFVVAVKTENRQTITIEQISFNELLNKTYDFENEQVKNYILPQGTPLGTSTVFQPPYSNSFSWGDKIGGIDEFTHGSNRYSGAVGAYANAFIGGATSEAMQQLDFYVGRTKTLTIDAKIIRTGGKLTFGFGAFSGTEKTWSWDDFQKNYHRSDVDPWWNWEIITLKIIQLVALLYGSTPQNIAQAISYLDAIYNFKDLVDQLQDLLDDSDAEILHITFSFSASPGYHTIWVGLRGSASACITGTASAVTMGLVEKITIDGICAPESPEVSGLNFGKVGEYYEFSAVSIDPNNDKIKYLFDWGDGTNSGWTELLPSGSKVSKSHSYSKKGIYTIKVTVEDIDKMQSQALFDMIITGKNPRANSLSNLNNLRFLDLINLFFKKSNI